MWPLVIPAFIAGVLMFLAPCTLPLVPGYLLFISGVSLEEMQDPKRKHDAERRILVNSLLYVVGFSLVFILFGAVFSSLGGLLGETIRQWIARIGGIFVMLFGLSMTGLFHLPSFVALDLPRRFSFVRHLSPGKPTSSFLFGAIFALGWTPCVGPVLGSILLLTTVTGTVLQGVFLLAIFSLGLAIPFLLIAFGMSKASRLIQRISPYMAIVSIISGLFVVFLGLLLVMGEMGVWLGFFYEHFHIIKSDTLLNYL